MTETGVSHQKVPRGDGSLHPRQSHTSLQVLSVDGCQNSLDPRFHNATSSDLLFLTPWVALLCAFSVTSERILCLHEPRVPVSCHTERALWVGALWVSRNRTLLITRTRTLHPRQDSLTGVGGGALLNACHREAVMVVSVLATSVGHSTFARASAWHMALGESLSTRLRLRNSTPGPTLSCWSIFPPL